jgi:hypothetical protein
VNFNYHEYNRGFLKAGFFYELLEKRSINALSKEALNPE